jgi:hypothetical protein
LNDETIIFLYQYLDRHHHFSGGKFCRIPILQLSVCLQEHGRRHCARDGQRRSTKEAMTLSEYFSENRYKPIWFIGDRVEGKWNGIPFVGSVGNDGLVSELEGPKVSVHVDLPILYKGKVYTIIFTKPDKLNKR